MEVSIRATVGFCPRRNPQGPLKRLSAKRGLRFDLKKQPPRRVTAKSLFVTATACPAQPPFRCWHLLRRQRTAYPRVPCLLSLSSADDCFATGGASYFRPPFQPPRRLSAAAESRQALRILRVPVPAPREAALRDGASRAARRAGPQSKAFRLPCKRPCFEWLAEASQRRPLRPKRVSGERGATLQLAAVGCALKASGCWEGGRGWEQLKLAENSEFLKSRPCVLARRRRQSESGMTTSSTIGEFNFASQRATEAFSLKNLFALASSPPALRRESRKTACMHPSFHSFLHRFIRECTNHFSLQKKGAAAETFPRLLFCAAERDHSSSDAKTSPSSVSGEAAKKEIPSPDSFFESRAKIRPFLSSFASRAFDLLCRVQKATAASNPWMI